MRYSTDLQKLNKLRRLIREGRLREVRKWLDQKKSIRFIRGRFKSQVCAIEIACATGFHDIVELLLQERQWSDGEKVCTVYQAIHKEHWHIVDLLIDHNTPIDELDFCDLAKNMDRGFLDKIVRFGCDPTRRDGLAAIIYNTGAKPLLRFYRDYKEQIPGLQDQVNLALGKCIRDRKLRTTILLIWAGADLASPAPCSANSTR